jgi:thiamine-monophosphate kinase
MLVEGRHFAAGVDPRSIGHKSLAVNLPDLAAMVAAPLWALLALGLPKAEAGWVESFADGFFALAARHGVELIGGDTTRSPLLTISVTAIGELPSGLALYRSAARAGDDVWVSGELGGAALALRHPEIAEAKKRLDWPEPRVELGERLRGLAHSAIDVSDGLAGDLGHIVERSRVRAVVEYDRIPRAAGLQALRDPELERACLLSGGDDYELIFTAPASRRDAIASLGEELGLAVTRIGAIEAGEPRVVVRDERGEPIAHRGGYDHFRDP